VAAQRPARLSDPVAGTVLREARRPRRPCTRRQHLHSQRQDRAGADLPTTLAGLLDRQSPDDLARRPALRVFCRAGHLPHRAAEKWKDDYAIEGVGDLGLHQLYRAMAWLGEVLPKDQQDGATPFAPRT